MAEIPGMVLNTSSEPLMADSKTQVETPQTDSIILPRDTYPNWWVYYARCHIIFSCYIVFHIMVIIVSTCWTISERRNLFTALLCFISIVAFPILMIFVFVYYNLEQNRLDSMMNKECKMQFLIEVITHKPNVCMDTWDRIAYNMNQIAYDHGICADKLLFYNGNSCYKFFNEMAVAPYKEFCNGNGSNINLETGSNQGTENINESGDNSLPFELKPFILKAVAVYRESVEKYWVDKYPEFAV